MSLWFSMKEIAKAHIRRIYKSGELTAVRLNKELDKADIIVVTVVRNESHRMEFFFNYYRSLGCKHFIIIDNESTDGTKELALSQMDASVYDAKGSYSLSRFGNDWVNEVLRQHCMGKWVLYVDPDELLVFPDYEASGLQQLIRHMDARGDMSLRCLMIDMYSSSKISENYVPSGMDPLSVCNLFDSTGYESRYEAFCQTEWTKGGVRGRIFFSEDIWKGPALNKTPLVKWKRNYAFLKSAHQVWPLSLNNGCQNGPGYLRGALLHFKFVSTMQEKVHEEASRRQHTDEYIKYERLNNGKDISFVGEQTVEYANCESLYKYGLIDGYGWNAGQARF